MAMSPLTPLSYLKFLNKRARYTSFCRNINERDMDFIPPGRGDELINVDNQSPVEF